MNLSIIGYGVVGQATEFAFQKLGHNVKIHDIRLNTKIHNVLDSELCFLCLPTPSNEDGSCCTKIVEGVIYDLVNLDYKGIICIKSTIEPGLTQRLIEKYPNHLICNVLEFLRERSAFPDAVENLRLLPIGTENDFIFNKVKECHGHLPQNVLKLHPTEAELLKLMHNGINTLRIIYANQIYEICEKLGLNYSKIKSGLLKTTQLPDQYLDVSPSLRGASGVCLPKDSKSLLFFAKKIGLNLKLIEAMVEENQKYKPTVFQGMRKE